jgi:hypothetical protein
LLGAQAIGRETKRASAPLRGPSPSHLSSGEQDNVFRRGERVSVKKFLDIYDTLRIKVASRPERKEKKQYFVIKGSMGFVR